MLPGAVEFTPALPLMIALPLSEMDVLAKTAMSRGGMGEGVGEGVGEEEQLTVT